jgi:hypothetical protein
LAPEPLARFARSHGVQFAHEATTKKPRGKTRGLFMVTSRGIEPLLPG